MAFNSLQLGFFLYKCYAYLYIVFSTAVSLVMRTGSAPSEQTETLSSFTNLPTYRSKRGKYKNTLTNGTTAMEDTDV